MTKKKVKSDEEMVTELAERMAGATVKRVTICDKITDTFEKEGWKMNEYWECEDDVMCTSFIDINLDQLSVFIDAELDKDLENDIIEAIKTKHKTNKTRGLHKGSK